jgi:hypothetical protein
MVIEATVRSLRPPDRVPARITTLSADQEKVIVEFLEWLALDDREGAAREDARAVRVELDRVIRSFELRRDGAER